MNKKERVRVSWKFAAVYAIILTAGGISWWNTGRVKYFTDFEEAPLNQKLLAIKANIDSIYIVISLLDTSLKLVKERSNPKPNSDLAQFATYLDVNYEKAERINSSISDSIHEIKLITNYLQKYFQTLKNTYITSEPVNDNIKKQAETDVTIAKTSKQTAEEKSARLQKDLENKDKYLKTISNEISALLKFINTNKLAKKEFSDDKKDEALKDSIVNRISDLDRLVQDARNISPIIY